jgi:DNA polymerase III alpha subunit (gram-positive type)
MNNKDLICFFDFETSSTDPKSCNIIESAWAVYSLKTHRKIASHSLVVRPKEKVDEFIEKFTKLTNEELYDFGVSYHALLASLKEGFVQAKYVAGHNIKSYDIVICSRLELGSTLENKIIIDTMTDLPEYPSKSRKLSHVACDNGIFNPFPHQAASDVDTAAALFFKFNPEDVIKLATSPIVYVRANVKRENKELAKERGYRWDGKNVLWYKEVKECKIDEEKALCEGAFEMTKLVDYMPPRD